MEQPKLVFGYIGSSTVNYQPAHEFSFGRYKFQVVGVSDSAKDVTTCTDVLERLAPILYKITTVGLTAEKGTGANVGKYVVTVTYGGKSAETSFASFKFLKSVNVRDLREQLVQRKALDLPTGLDVRVFDEILSLLIISKALPIATPTLKSVLKQRLAVSSSVQFSD